MGRSPESPLSLCPCPTPVEPAIEALEVENAVPIPQAAIRRKSSTWKTFNFKRQLSKVDLKLKNTGRSLKEKRNSIFYSDVSPNCDNLDDKSSPESDNEVNLINPAISANICKKNERDWEGRDEYPDDVDMLKNDDDNSVIVGFSPGSDLQGVRKVGFTSRPDNLELLDEYGYPMRHPKQVKKKGIDKRDRDQRLLSVPNIKFQKSELQSFHDLRDKEESTTPATQPSFAGNLIRRFSKF